MEVPAEIRTLIAHFIIKWVIKVLRSVIQQTLYTQLTACVDNLLIELLELLMTTGLQALLGLGGQGQGQGVGGQVGDEEPLQEVGVGGLGEGPAGDV